MSRLWLDEKRNYVKESSVMTYRQILDVHLLPYFGTYDRIGQEEVQTFAMDKLGSGLSRKSVSDMLVVLRMIGSYGRRKELFDMGEWKVDYPTPREEPKATPTLGHRDQTKLLHYLLDNLTSRNLGILISMSTGLRIGELCALKWKNVNTRTQCIEVRHTLERIYDGRRSYIVINSPKTTNSIRDVPLNEDLARILANLKRVGINQDNYVLTGSPKPTEPRAYRKHYADVLQKLKIPHIKFHSLRHSFATRCVESRCDYKTISAILGHANLSTTLDLYVHPSIGAKRQCIRKMYKDLCK